MTRALALDLAEYGIRVNAVAPGAIMVGGQRVHHAPDDPKRVEWLRRYPAGRVGLPRDIAAAVAFLASPDADYITGEILYVDGGITAQLSPRNTPI
jgi:NAD(P)-dependent dehydrogenase (short-subunit alcohol dehydrogenase family)